MPITRSRTGLTPGPESSSSQGGGRDTRRSSREPSIALTPRVARQQQQQTLAHEASARRLTSATPYGYPPIRLGSANSAQREDLYSGFRPEDLMQEGETNLMDVLPPDNFLPPSTTRRTPVTNSVRRRTTTIAEEPSTVERSNPLSRFGRLFRSNADESSTPLTLYNAQVAEQQPSSSSIASAVASPLRGSLNLIARLTAASGDADGAGEQQPSRTASPRRGGKTPRKKVTDENDRVHFLLAINKKQ